MNVVIQPGRLKGKAWKFGDDVDTDVIIPARYLNSSDPAELAAHCLEDADAEFSRRARPGDIVVAGKNFGCGSSREHAPVALKAVGVSCVVAESFARIFYRNAINIGLPIFESVEAARAVRAGDTVEVDPASGTIKVVGTDDVFQAEPFPEFMQKIMAAGGLIGYVRERLATR